MCEHIAAHPVKQNHLCYELRALVSSQAVYYTSCEEQCALMLATM